MPNQQPPCLLSVPSKAAQIPKFSRKAGGKLAKRGN